jgi:hypothetical protein
MVFMVGKREAAVAAERKVEELPEGEESPKRLEGRLTPKWQNPRKEPREYVRLENVPGS